MFSPKYPVDAGAKVLDGVADSRLEVLDVKLVAEHVRAQVEVEARAIGLFKGVFKRVYFGFWLLVWNGSAEPPAAVVAGWSQAELYLFVNDI